MTAKKKSGRKAARQKSKKLGNNRALFKVFSLRASAAPRMPADS
jgi:hypothetical protein